MITQTGSNKRLAQ